MNPYLTIPLVVVIGIVQSTIVSRLRVFGVSPDLVLLFAISWVLVFSMRDGLFFALVGGLMLDAFSGAPFGLATASLLLASYLTAQAELNLFRTARILPYLSIALATLVYYAVFLFLLQMTGLRMPWGAALWRVVLPATCVNLLCMPAVYHALRWLYARLGPPSVEWE